MGHVLGGGMASGFGYWLMCLINFLDNEDINKEKEEKIKKNDTFFLSVEKVESKKPWSHNKAFQN